MKLKELAEILGGSVIGNPEVEITGAAGIREAQPGQITFVSSPRYLKHLFQTKASCVIVKDNVESAPAPLLKVENPQYAFARALELFYPRQAAPAGISDKAVVSPKASLGPGVTVMPFAYIGDDAVIGEGTVIAPFVFIGERTRIGCRCVLHPQVTVREEVIIGDRVIIHAGTVIGADGFGYVFEKGEHYKIPQVGGVIIEDDVEIGANSSVDRATIGNTVVGRGTKIDNLVQIGHNVKIGAKSILVAQVAIGGSAEIGSYVTLAGQVGIADHALIESETIIAARSGASGAVRKGVYAGAPIIPHKDWLRASVLFGKLPEMSRKLRELEDRLHTIEKGKVQ
ncbi:MAG: UDP-3-O-(3-hydroxymyristoyl)glucosamine N-acyltransferase [Nitrospiraceae bacterium]|nr:UDP-3-O-(3-hydroxymyristoyl)glucosamine N-acyltransferase [Nitrospiraceae bacterium]